MNTFISSLRFRIILIAVLALLPAWAMMLFSISRQRAIIESDVMKECLRAAELAASNEEKVIEGARQVLASLDLFFNRVQWARKDCQGYLKALSEHFRRYADMGAVDSRGDVICRAWPGGDPLSVADAPWFKRALHSTCFMVGDYQLGEITGRPVLMVTSPVIGSDGRVEGVLYAAIDLDWLDEFYVPQTVKSSEGAFFAVVDRSGTTLSHYPESRQWPPSVKEITLLEAVREGQSKVGMGQSPQGDDYVYAISPIKSRWPSRAVSVVIGIPGKTAFSEANRSRNLNLLLLGGVSLLMLAAFWTAASSILLRRLEALFAAARRLTAGDLSARSGLDQRGDELGHFARAFDEMAQSLEHREREHREAEARIRSSEEQLRRLQTHAQGVREEERLRLAREIHDDLGQALTALKIDLSWLRRRAASEEPEAMHGKLDAMARIIDDAMETVHHVSSELRPRILDDLGLAEAIEWQAEEFQRRTGIACEVSVGDPDLPIAPEQSTALFRIFQEALTNVSRHSGAANVNVSLEMDAAGLVLRIADDGRGIRPEEIDNPLSYGLMGIRERVHALGGSVEITGSVGAGTTLKVSIPPTSS